MKRLIWRWQLPAYGTPQTIKGAQLPIEPLLEKFCDESSGGGSVDISSVTDSLQSNLIDLATKAGVACAAVVGACLTIFGIKWVVKKIMGFFKVIGN